MAAVVQSAGGYPAQAAQPKRKGGPCQSVGNRQQMQFAKGSMPSPPPGIPVPMAPAAMVAPPPGSTGSKRLPGNFMPRRLCTHWLQRGLCKRADECNFAHGFQELHPDSRAEGARQLGMSVPQATQVAQAGGIMPGPVPVAMPPAAGRTQQRGSTQPIAVKAQGVPPSLSVFASLGMAGGQAATLPSPCGDGAVVDPFKFNAGAVTFEPTPGMPSATQDAFRFSVSANPFLPPALGTAEDGADPTEEQDISPQKIELSDLTAATKPAIPGLARRAPPSPAAMTECTPKAGDRRVSLASALKSPTAAQSPTIARKASFGLMSPKAVAVRSSSVMFSAPALTLGVGAEPAAALAEHAAPGPDLCHADRPGAPRPRHVRADADVQGPQSGVPAPAAGPDDIGKDVPDHARNGPVCMRGDGTSKFYAGGVHEAMCALWSSQFGRVAELFCVARFLLDEGL